MEVALKQNQQSKNLCNSAGGDYWTSDLRDIVISSQTPILKIFLTVSMKEILKKMKKIIALFQ